MSHWHEVIEPTVISESLLKECVIEQGPQGEAGRVAKLEGINFEEVQELRLDFKNILRIENLWQFTSLRKLQLDNNVVEDISGLEMLIHLEWLDLSFNNIEVISGLENLVKLKDLSLANNHIKTIANLDPLIDSLQVLSVANNIISSLKCVECLRPFRKLRSLTLRGNPVAAERNYKLHIVAYLPSLVYLDFKFIMENIRQEATTRYAETIQGLELQEREQVRLMEAEHETRKKEEELESAYVDGLQGPVLFDAMFKDDIDAQKIKLLPEVVEKLKKFKEEFITCCEDLTTVGLEQKKKRDAELELFKMAYSGACKKNQALSVKKINEFEKQKDKISDAEEPSEAIKHLQHSLLWLEMQLVEQLDEISKDFELNYGDMISSFKESVQSFMTQMRELENRHHEEVTENGLVILEQFSKNQIDEILDDLKPLLVDKDTLLNILNTSHDTHMLVIDEKEDTILQRSAKDLAVILKNNQTRELARNRRKVAEIEHSMEAFKKVD